ncbi:MAG TPA: hypothetical protein PKA58_20600, partial [Polyangium sp.]|nr:hypothetical protein [Polyangium sp.]
ADIVDETERETERDIEKNSAYRAAPRFVRTNDIEQKSRFVTNNLEVDLASTGVAQAWSREESSRRRLNR